VSPEQFIAQLQRQRPSPAYLFLGAEPYRLRACREALVARVLPPEEREEGLRRFDLAETPLAAVLDDARSLSLFTPRRIIWVSSAEAVLPRTRSAARGEEDADTGGRSSLAGYLKAPSPDVVLVFEASRWDLEGEDKARVERVAKFYSPDVTQVELSRLKVQEARRLAYDLARQSGLEMDRADLDVLAEMLDSDALRIAAEIEKLRLFAGPGRQIRREDMAALVPDTSTSTAFALVDALGHGDRLRALELLGALIRQGEYLPLALSFLASLFRLALAAKEEKIRTAHDIQERFSRPGRPIWRSRAEQVQRTAAKFSKAQLETVLKGIHDTDRALRDARPDDRIVVEDFVLRLAR
jgi:DNA polymerase-3 subunit delta